MDDDEQNILEYLFNEKSGIFRYMITSSVMSV